MTLRVKMRAPKLSLGDEPLTLKLTQLVVVNWHGQWKWQQLTQHHQARDEVIWTIERVLDNFTNHLRPQTLVDVRCCHSIGRQRLRVCQQDSDDFSLHFFRFFEA